jgi:hypothetical protein
MFGRRVRTLCQIVLVFSGLVTWVLYAIQYFNSAFSVETVDGIVLGIMCLAVAYLLEWPSWNSTDSAMSGSE